MSKLQKILSILIALAIPPACGKAPVENMQVIYEDFTEANMFHLSSPGVFVFKDSDSWDSFCNEYWTGDYPGNNIPRPEVDFEVDMVVGIFWGQTGGCYHWVNCVRAVSIKHDIIEVHIGRPDLGRCDRIIWPKQIIKMKRYDFPVEFYGHVPGGS